MIKALTGLKYWFTHAFLLLTFNLCVFYSIHKIFAQLSVIFQQLMQFLVQIESVKYEGVLCSFVSLKQSE